MSRIYRSLSGLIGAFVLGTMCVPQATAASPVLGAEVYIEPGQSVAEIDRYMATLQANHIAVARIFMMWNYLEKKPDQWDFTLWDAAFDAAQRHGVRITATLVPNSPPPFWGERFSYRVHVGDMLATRAERDRSLSYVEQVVARYRNHPALDSWWLFNEPGQAPAPDPLALEEFRATLARQYLSIDALNAKWLTAYASFADISVTPAWSTDFWAWPQAFLDWNRFWRGHLNDQIGWLAQAVRRLDPRHQTHTNPRDLINGLAHYDLGGMADQVTAIGASIHPTWHFGKLPRDRFGMGVSWNNDYLHGIAGKRPYWVSELQGGDNLYSGTDAGAPTADELAQWIWTSIGSGAQRVIFWSLNARRTGNEAGEWSLMSLDGAPSARLDAASAIGKIVDDHAGTFAAAKPLASHVTIVVSRETALVQERKANRYGTQEGSKEGLHTKSVLACYMALLQRGIVAQLVPIEAVDWDTKRSGRTIILADTMALSAEDAHRIDRFVFGGGTLIDLGLTGLFDENEESWLGHRPSPLAKARGGTLHEVTLAKPKFDTRVGSTMLPTHLWRGLITPGAGAVAARDEDGVVAVRNSYGRGRSTWLPSGVGIGGWLTDLEPLADFLSDEIGITASDAPFRFERFNKDCWLRTMRVGAGYVTMVFNASGQDRDVKLVAPAKLRSSVLFGAGWDAAGTTAHVGSGKTLVIRWE